MYNTYWACCIFYVNISNGPYIIFFSSLIVRSNFWAFNFYIVYIPNWQDILMVLGLIQPSVKWIILSFVYKQNDSSLLFTTKVGFQKQMAVLIGLCKMGLNQSWNLIIYWPLQNQLNIKICLKSSQVLAYKLLIETSKPFMQEKIK